DVRSRDFLFRPCSAPVISAGFSGLARCLQIPASPRPPIYRDLQGLLCEPTPRGGSTSPLEMYSQQILALIRPDFTLDEIVSALRKRRLPGSRSALSRFFARHRIRTLTR